MNEEIMDGLATSTVTQEGNEKSVKYFEEVKRSEFGWQMCLQALIGRKYSSKEHAQFFCLQVVEYYIKTRYAQDLPANQEVVRSFFRVWPNIQTTTDNTFIRNKIAQLATLVFLQDYPRSWPAFFSEFLSLLAIGDPAVDYYLRVLKAIDAEIADHDVARSLQEIQRNNSIKDAMRESAIVPMVDSWFLILTTYRNKNPVIVELCHFIIGAYIRWIDINLIANNRFVPVLVDAMNHYILRESAADCIYDIIGKKMEALSKVKLVESFHNYLATVGVWQSFEGLEDDVDYLAKLGKVLNGMGINLVESYHKMLKSSGPESAESTLAILEAIETKIPLMLQIIVNEDDDVSASVFEFLRDYLHLLKSKPVLTELDMYHIADIVKAVCGKIRYDPDYNFDHEGEEEICFKDFRKQLKIVIDNLISVDKPLVIDQLRMIIANTLQNWKQLPFQDVEAALMLLYLLGENVYPGISHFSAEPEKYSTIQKLLLVLAASEVNLHTHSAVTLEYFEVSVRYEKFYLHHPEFILQVLTTFLKTSGVFHSDRKVRSRSAYLLSRFIKAIRSQINPELTQQILQAVQPLLEIFDSSAQTPEPLLSHDDQLYIYEVVGVVILAGGEAGQQKRSDYMNQAVAPLLLTYQNLVEKLKCETQVERTKTLYELLSQIVSVIGRLSKAFTPQETMKTCGCSQIFLGALDVFLKGVQSCPSGELRLELSSTVRQFFHRLVVCLEAEILEIVPHVTRVLIGDFSVQSIQEYIPVLNQIISKHKKDVTPYLTELLPPLSTMIIDEIGKPIPENDLTTRREIMFLQKQYYQLISCILTNNLPEVFPAFNTDVMKNIIMFITGGAVHFSDASGQKICFQILKKMVELWANSADYDHRSQFLVYMYNNILPACFHAPGLSTFDMTDAQCMLVLNETAMCLKCMYENRGEEFVVHLRNDFLPSIQMAPPDIEEYVFALQGTTRDFKEFLKKLFLIFKRLYHLLDLF